MKHDTYAQKVVWITGTSTGIGKALAQELLARGAFVIGSARDTQALAQVSDNQNYIPLPVDVTDMHALQAVAQHIQLKFGKLDILIANAGICEYIEMPHFDTHTIENVMNVNYMGCVKTIAVALPLLFKAENPYLLGMASSNAYVGLPRSEAYGPSKAAVYNLMQALKADLYNAIDVSVICPGFVESPLTDKNDFDMPARISAKKSAEYILAAMNKRVFDIHFPKRFTGFIKLLTWLPDSLVFKITQRFAR